MNTDTYVWEPGEYPLVIYRVLIERSGQLLLIVPEPEPHIDLAFWRYSEHVCHTRLEALQSALEYAEAFQRDTAPIKRAVASEKRKQKETNRNNG